MIDASLLKLAALVALAFLVETAAGFGSMVVALTLGALWFEVNQLLAWLVPVNMILSTRLVLQDRAALDARFLFKRMLPAMTLGLLVGTLVAALVSGLGLKLAFGVLVVVLSVWQLWQLRRGDQALTALPGVVRVVALFVAGIIHGIFGTGGPLAVFVSGRELSDKKAFRATLSALWLLLNGMLIVRLAQEGSLSLETLTVSALLLIPLAIGMALGELVHRRLDERQFRFAVSGLLGVAGSVLVISTLQKAA